MKTLISLVLCAFMALPMSAQNNGRDILTFNDSNAYGDLSMRIELPSANTTVNKAIRKSIFVQLQKCLCTDLMYGDTDNAVPAYTGSSEDMQAMCNYYGKAAMKKWKKIKDAEYDETRQYILEDKDMSEAEKAEALKDMPKFSIDMKLEKSYSSSHCIVYTYDVYGYNGGAHGGVYGNFFTFNAKTGALVKNFFRPGVAKAMQPLIKKGLKRYFANSGEKMMSDSELMEALQISGTVIPLPQSYSVTPSKEGLVLTYAQYEIACYAAGMPSFTIPYSQARPYMTKEAKDMLGIK